MSTEGTKRDVPEPPLEWLNRRRAEDHKRIRAMEARVAELLAPLDPAFQAQIREELARAPEWPVHDLIVEAAIEMRDAVRRAFDAGFAAGKATA